ncbi:MAG: hypothetical protein AVDCRST_MAG53-942 [uncultured Solirubrobacteraceae bacterium]|uniref:Uncharacterized protein n=1 Tax=uncultured Solirubrobacteraceae bacterium TaxID=1162706 RepID=A0A6J4S7B4_9ACTN|nr:MAG: hypothetical protein AVDCRST_MAG53-942 [uncultured Solirubrobacteraceae bacterium]
MRDGGSEDRGAEATVLLARGVHEAPRVARMGAAARVHEQAEQALGLRPALHRVLLVDVAGHVREIPDPLVGLVAAADAALGQALQKELDALATLVARPRRDDVDRLLEGLGILAAGDLLQGAHAQLGVLVALQRCDQEAALELARLVEVEHRPRAAPARRHDACPRQSRPHVLLAPVEELDGDAPELALEDLVAALLLRAHRHHAALDADAPAPTAPHGPDDDRPAAVYVAVEQRVEGDDRVVVLRRGVDEVDHDARLLARMAARDAAHALLVDALGRRGGQVHADGRTGGVPALREQLCVDEHVDVAPLVGGQARRELALRSLARDRLGLDPRLAQRLGDVVGVPDACCVQHSRNAVEPRLVEVGDRHVERRLVEQLGQHLLVELDVDLAAAQRHLRDRAHPLARRDADAAQGRDDAAARGLGEVEARRLRREEVGDVPRDERPRRRHADEDRARPLADRRARLLAERGVRLVADDHGVHRGDLPRVPDEPLVGLDGDGAVGAEVVLRAEQWRRDAVAVAARGELVVELVDEVATVGEDEHAAGARRLDEAHRRDGLARARRVLEPEALARVGILEGAVVDVLVDVAVAARVVVLVGVRLILGLLVLSRRGRQRFVLLLVVVLLLRRRGDDLVLTVLGKVEVLLLVVLVLVGLRLFVGLHPDSGTLRVGNRGVGRRLVDSQHGRGRRRRDGAAVALFAGEQRGERARQRVDLVRVQRRAVGEHDLLVGEHPLEAEHERVAPAPFRGGDGQALLQLRERTVQRPAAGTAGGERRSGLLPGVQEELAREALGLSDLLRSGKGGGRRHARGLGHEALATQWAERKRFRASQDPGTTPGTAWRRDLPSTSPPDCGQDTAPAGEHAASRTLDDDAPPSPPAARGHRARRDRHGGAVGEPGGGAALERRDAQPRGGTRAPRGRPGTPRAASRPRQPTASRGHGQTRARGARGPPGRREQVGVVVWAVPRGVPGLSTRERRPRQAGRLPRRRRGRRPGAGGEVPRGVPDELPPHLRSQARSRRGAGYRRLLLADDRVLRRRRQADPRPPGPLSLRGRPAGRHREVRRTGAMTPRLRTRCPRAVPPGN